jgi:hypothetical protein
MKWEGKPERLPSQKSCYIQILDNFMTLYNNQIEREMGRMGGNTQRTNEWEGETEKDAFSKKKLLHIKNGD